MKLHEYQAKEIFSRYGIAVPKNQVVSTVEEAQAAVESMGGRAALKAQVHAGGRGLAGGVKLVRSPEEAGEVARSMLGRSLVTNQTGPEGVPINQLLVEELADIKRELYVAITIDRGFRGPVMIVSAAGGMDIESVAESSPKDIHTEPIEPVLGLMPFQTRPVGPAAGHRTRRGPGGGPGDDQAVPGVCGQRLFYGGNQPPNRHRRRPNWSRWTPRWTWRDDALFRHPELQAWRDRSQEDALEAEAADQDIAYVNLDGDVGCLVNGAGLAMATLDVTNAAGAAPANFLDVGGGATDEKVAQAVGIMLSDPKVRRVLVNVFGGILRCDVAARGIVLAYQRTNSQLPLIVRMLGTNLEEGKSILAGSGLNVTFADTLTDAAQAIKQAV